MRKQPFLKITFFAFLHSLCYHCVAFTSPQKISSLSRKKWDNRITYNSKDTLSLTNCPFQQRKVSSTSMKSALDTKLIAEGLGYLVGAGSFVLYTPIAVRIVRQGSADGLTISTWWLKLVSYTCSDVYAFTNGYDISTYVETLIITIEAFVILCLTAKYQKLWDNQFLLGIGIYGCVTTSLLVFSPSELIALGQGSAAILNVAALIPQFIKNSNEQTAGDYSPVTASLAATGCVIRLFTTVQLAGSDPLLLGSFGLAAVVNTSLLLQILYYGVMVEGKSFKYIMFSDIKSPPTQNLVDDEELIF